MSKLQLYFDYYAEHHNPINSDWYKKIKLSLSLMQAIQDGLPSDTEFQASTDKKALLEASFVKSTKSLEEHIDTIESLLERFVFKQDNGIGNVKQGVVWETADSPHRRDILTRATPDCIYQILSGSNIAEVNDLVDSLLNGSSSRNHPAVKNRLMRTLFPNNFCSPDAPNKLVRLLKVLKTKLGVSIAEEVTSANNPELAILAIHQELCNRINTDDPILRQTFTWELFYMLENEVSLKKAICYYGAPGTGKTYQSSREAKKIIDAQRIIVDKPVGGKYAIKTVQFHPSYSYEDFMEGIRPSNEGRLKLFNGSFKQFCKDHGATEIALYENTAFLSNPVFKRVEYDFAKIYIRDLKPDEKEVLGLTNQDYAEELTIQDAIEPAFFIIDEINRAELSKVFGELMYSLEYRGYRGKIKTQYSHLCETSDDTAAFLWEDNENWFFIPQNIYIISTMNNIDRSVDAFDFALRRRFMWKEVEPDYNIINVLFSERKSWSEFGEKVSGNLKALNLLIENDDILDKNYRVGQSYVLEVLKLSPERFENQSGILKFIWDSFIAPLLEEYLRGLGNEQKSREKIERFKSAFLG